MIGRPMVLAGHVLDHVTHNGPAEVTVQQRLTQEQKIAYLREQTLFLVDEIFAREKALPTPPERICPGCQREMPPSSADDR